MKIHRSVETIEPYLRNAPIPPVALLGLCTHGLTILRSVARKGIPAIAVEANFQQPSAHSRYGVKLRVPDLYEDALIDLLIDLARRSTHEPVLFVTNDKMVRLVNRHQGVLREYFHLPLPDAALLSRIIEKDSMMELAARQGLRLPKSRIFHRDATSKHDLERGLEGITFPCVLKPAVPMSSFKVLKLSRQEEVADAIRRHPDIDRFVLQEWIDGGDERLFFVAYYFDMEGRVKAYFIGQKIRQFPRTLGNSCAARGVDRPDLVEEGLKFFRGLGYRGLGSVEFKLSPSGQPYFIEATVGRSDYWLKTLIVNGVDLPVLAYTDLTGVRIPATCRQENRAVWVDSDRDIWVYLESFFDPHCSKRELIRFLFARKRYALFDIRDLRPFWRSWIPFLREAVRHLLNRADRLRVPQRPSRAAKAT